MQDYNITTGAVCVYPNQVKSAVKWLKAAGVDIPVASVATGFPAGQTPLRLRLEEIREAVEDGAREIDIVINRTYVSCCCYFLTVVVLCETKIKFNTPILRL